MGLNLAAPRVEGSRFEWILKGRGLGCSERFEPAASLARIRSCHLSGAQTVLDVSAKRVVTVAGILKSRIKQCCLHLPEVAAAKYLGSAQYVPESRTTQTSTTVLCARRGCDPGALKPSAVRSPSFCGACRLDLIRPLPPTRRMLPLASNVPQHSAFLIKAWSDLRNYAER